jgi:hypothetical protein
MDIPFLRNEFLKEKEFLHSLYSNGPRKNKKKIDNASLRQLNILIKISHLISNGQIGIKSSDAPTFKKSRRQILFHDTFEKRDNFLSILNAPEESKKKELKKFSALYPILLKTMFESAD